MKGKALLFVALLTVSPFSVASGKNEHNLTISNHRFEPSEITIAANTVVKLVVHNKDANFEEFHSDSLHREKVIAPNAKGVIKIGPLPPGTYEFMGEFHAETAQGRVIVK